MPEYCLLAASSVFESARCLPELAASNPEAQLHGHSFKVACRFANRTGLSEFAGGELDAVTQRLHDTTQALSYKDLNQIIESPSNANLAAWFCSELEDLGPASVDLASTAHEGVVLRPSQPGYAWRRYSFQADHQLPHVPVGHKCGNMHGHGFEVILHAQLPGGGFGCSSLDLAALYQAIDSAWTPLHQALHLACLNDIAGLENPTSEQISCWLWSRLVKTLPGLHLVTVYENASCWSIFNGQQVRIWKELSMDSALSLRHAPEGDGRRGVHGHTYALRLHLMGPIDEVLGWTVDFGDVKQLFKPIFQRFDHKPLHEIAELDDCDAVSLAQWLRQQSSPMLPALNRIDLYPTRHQGVVLGWAESEPAVSV